MTVSCPICAEINPQFYKPSEVHLITATAPFERLSIDFKGPVTSITKNAYLLTIIDEFSSFPSAYPFPNMTLSTVTEKLCDLFTKFGRYAIKHPF